MPAPTASARALGGPSLRKRSAALIEDDLLLDLGPDLVAAAQQHAVSLAKVAHCLQTHAHADHLDPANFHYRSAEYGVPDPPRLHFYASDATARRAAPWLTAQFDAAPAGEPVVDAWLNLEIHRVVPLRPFDAGPYRVTAFPANHDATVEPLLYAIEAGDAGDPGARGGRAVFYGVDTAALPEDTWGALRRHGLRFDLVVLDHTYGPDAGQTDHLNARHFAAHVVRMREEGLLAPGARVLAHHIAHETNPPHPELVAAAAHHGYEVAYDGLIISI